jgi:hypothetical protein
LGIAIAALGAVCALALAAVSVTAATLPGCTSCHDESTFAEQTAALAHAEVACVTCHVGSDVASRLSFGAIEVFGMAVRVVPVAGRAVSEVSDTTCLSCHADILGRVADSKGKRIAHATCSVSGTCSSCHSGTAHGSAVRWQRVAKMDDCLECHDTDEVLADCDTCHDAKTPEERLGAGAWNVTHGEAWPTTHGMGDQRTCGACHAEDFCARCHEISLPHGSGFIGQHGETAIESPGACTTCHRQEFCSGCHGIEMPHTPSFTPAHSERVRDLGEEVCLTCHDSADCELCHFKHIHPGGAIAPPQGGDS